jgi:hypothetical protein
MATTRPFAYNTGSTITDTEQVGQLAIGGDPLPYSENYGGVSWKNGPDEDLGYVIGYPQSGGTQPLPVSGTGYVQFWRSKIPGDDTSFINLAEYISRKYSTPQTFANANDAKIWLNSNGFWTSYDQPVTPTPTETSLIVTPTPTPTGTSIIPTPTPTPTATDLSSITTYTISSCSGPTTLVVDLGPGFIVPGDVLYFTFSGITPSGCYSVVGKINSPTDDSIITSFSYADCLDCETSNVTPTPTETSVIPTPTPTETSIPVTPTTTPTPTPTETSIPVTPTTTPTPTPTNPALLQMLNETTGSRTITSLTLDGITQPLSSGSYPITAGNNGFALTHGTNSNPNGVVFNFSGSGTFDLYSYLNGTLVNYLASYNNNTYTMGGTILQSSDQLLLRITDAGTLPTPTPTITPTQTNLPPTPTPTSTNNPTPTPTPTSGATAPFSVSFVESGPNVLLSYSGTLDLTGLNFVQNTTSGSGGVGPAQAAFGIGPTGTIDVSLYTGATFSYPSNFGTGGGGPSSVTGTGNYFGVFSGILPTNSLVVPSGYTSNSFISGTTTLSGSSFTSLGLSAGTYNYSWGAGAGQSFVLTIGGVGPTPTPTATSVTPTPTPTSGSTGVGWFFYSPDNQPVLDPPSNNGDTTFINSGDGNGTYNPNYTGGTLSLYFNNNNSAGTSYASQFSTLDTAGGTITISQGSNTVIYSGTSTDYQSAGGSFIFLNVTRSAQMIQSASTPFVSGTSINVVVS